MKRELKKLLIHLSFPRNWHLFGQGGYEFLNRSSHHRDQQRQGLQDSHLLPQEQEKESTPGHPRLEEEVIQISKPILTSATNAVVRTL